MSFLSTLSVFKTRRGCIAFGVSFPLKVGDAPHSRRQLIDKGIGIGERGGYAQRNKERRHHGKGTRFTSIYGSIPRTTNMRRFRRMQFELLGSQISFVVKAEFLVSSRWRSRK